MADVPPDPSSGAAGTEFHTIEALRRLGAEVDAIWAPQLGRRIGHGNLHYLIELPRAYRRAMLQAFSRADYDVVHANQPHGYLAAAALHRRRPSSVFIHRSHGLELRVEEELRPWRKRFDVESRSIARRAVSGAMTTLLARHSFKIAREADGHIVSSTGCGDFLEKRLGVAREKIAVIPQGVPTSFIETPPLSMTRERLNRVLYAGQFAFVKAPSIVADAMSSLLLEDSKRTATWVCAAEHHEHVRALLHRDIRSRVQLSGWIPLEQLRAIYDQHGILLFPSFFEGFGKVFLEAMSRGLCVVATDVGGARDVIRNHQNGVLVPPGDAKALVEACQALLSSPDRAIAMSREAVRTAREYTWERAGKLTLDFYSRRLSAKQ